MVIIVGLLYDGCVSGNVLYFFEAIAFNNLFISMISVYIRLNEKLMRTSPRSTELRRIGQRTIKGRLQNRT